MIAGRCHGTNIQDYPDVDAGTKNFSSLHFFNLSLNHFLFFTSKELLNVIINLNKGYENKILYDDSIYCDTFIHFMSERYIDS
jgi:hypothetical protein